MSGQGLEEAKRELDDTTQKKNTNTLQDIVQKECCEGRKRYECTKHFLTSDFTALLLANLDDSMDQKKAHTANMVAELGKYETSRMFLSQPILISKLVLLLKSSNLDVLIQACRALANISYEKGDGLKLVLDRGGVPAVLQLLKLCVDVNKVEHNPQLQAACIGFLVNLLSDNETIHKQVWADGAILQVCMTLLKLDLKDGAVTSISHNIFVILVTLTETIPVEQVFTSDLCDLAVDMFRNSFHDEFVMTGLDFLEDAEVPDLVKENLAKSGLFELFVNLMDKKPENLTEEEVKKYDLTGRVLANILTGDEAMEYVYARDEGSLMKHVVGWLTNQDMDLVYAGVLCIGNIARTDKHSTQVVEQRVHLPLMRILRDTSIDMKMQHAVLSTLRNLSIPKCNKLHLVQAGLIEVLLPLLSLDLEQSSPVIFKLVGTLRQLVDGNQKLASELAVNETLVARVVVWAASTVCPWVSSECVRLLCWLVKTSKDRQVMQSILEHGGYTHILNMLTATHGVMQNEAVSALTITAAVAAASLLNTNNSNQNGGTASMLDKFDSVLVENEVGDKLNQLVSHHAVRMDGHAVENVFTFLEIITKFDVVAQHLKESDLTTVLTSKMGEREDFSKFRSRVEDIENSI